MVYVRISKGHCGETRYLLQTVLVHKGSKSTKGHYYIYTHRSKKVQISPFRPGVTLVTNRYGKSSTMRFSEGTPICYFTRG